MAWTNLYFEETGGMDPAVQEAIESTEYKPVYGEYCEELAMDRYGIFGRTPGAPFIACHGKKIAVGLGVLAVLWIVRPLIQIGSDIFDD